MKRKRAGIVCIVVAIGSSYLGKWLLSTYGLHGPWWVGPTLVWLIAVVAVGMVAGVFLLLDGPDDMRFFP
jgi:hypothetical protein